MMQVVVSRIGHKGDGIAETADGQVHVPKVLKGEVLEIEAGKLSAVLTPSPDRIVPFCPHYDQCGGCKFQHWREEPYRAWKRGLVIAALAQQGLATDVRDLIDAHGAGRRRVSLHVRLIDGQWRAGFMEQKSHDLCAIKACPVLAAPLSRATEIAAAFGPSLGNCDVALAAAANGIDVAVRAERSAVAKRFAALSTIANAFGLLRLSVNGEVVAMCEQPVVQMGRAMVPLPVQSFLQSTAAGENELSSLVLASRPRKARHVADLFSGVGTFSLRLAERLRVTAIDSDKSAIVALEKAVRTTQGLKPIAASVRNLFAAPLTPAELKEHDWVVLDPPRAGAEAQARQLARSAITAVTYVSCDVQSFARDARLLADGGLALRSVTPVDQFKWTAHVEMVGQFSR